MQMTKIIFSLVILIIIDCITIDFTGISKCPCNVYTSQNDCELAKCTWKETNCIEFNCSVFTDWQNCNSNGHCTFKPDNTCSAFTKCSDYYYKDPQGCTESYCQAGKFDGTYYQCVNPKKCTEITDSSECDEMGCFVGNNSCQVPQCSIQDQDHCDYIRQDDLWSTKFCSYVDSACVDANEDNIGQDTCERQTERQYIWNSDSQTCNSACNSYENQLTIIKGIIYIVFLYL